MSEEQSKYKAEKNLNEHKVLACIEDGEVKCACSKETCETCEFREDFNCIEAKLIIT